MREWVFPTFAFLIFVYLMVFTGIYIHKYSNSNIPIYNANKPSGGEDINVFLEEISKSFKN